jgi:hypothetical protein
VTDTAQPAPAPEPGRNPGMTFPIAASCP